MVGRVADPDSVVMVGYGSSIGKKSFLSGSGSGCRPDHYPSTPFSILNIAVTDMVGRVADPDSVVMVGSSLEKSSFFVRL